MKCLIVEDDFISRRILKEFLSPYFDCDIAVNGEEGISSFRLASEAGAPYDLICMDIMMPELDGNIALEKIRELENVLGIPQTREVKVLMTTALDDPRTVLNSFYKGGATSYLVKPITRQKLLLELQKLGLLHPGP